MLWAIWDRKERETKWGNASRTEICFCFLYALGPFHPYVPPPVSRAGAGAHPTSRPLVILQLWHETVQKVRLDGRRCGWGRVPPQGATRGRCRELLPGRGYGPTAPNPGGCPAWGAVESGSAGLPLLQEIWALQRAVGGLTRASL